MRDIKAKDRFTEPIEMRYAPRKQRALPRCFLLKWNNAYIHSEAQSRFDWHECWGTLYPNGIVSLDFGSGNYRSLTDLKDHVSQAGIYLIQWVEEEE